MAAKMHTQGQRHDRISDDATQSQQRVQPSPALRTGGPSPDDTNLTQKLMSAVVGSVLTSLVVTPLDVVRVRLQAQKSPSPTANLPSFLQLPPNLGVTACCREVFWVQNQSQFCVAAPAQAAAAVVEPVVSDCAAAETQRRTINSTFDGLRKIARNEGFWTLWRGLSPTLAMGIPANVIYFAGYDWLRWNPNSPMKSRVSEELAPLVDGSLARILAAGVVSPIEMLRTRMQAVQSGGAGGQSVMRATIGGLSDMVREQGVHTLWRGITLTFWRDVPFSALYWWGYEWGRKRLDEGRAHKGSITGKPLNEQLTHSELLYDSFLAGAGSGAIAAFVTTPFDVGKTRQQTLMDSSLSPQKRASLPEGKAMPKFLYHIYCTEGWSGLFKGWGARTLKVAPACAIMISSYEVGKQLALKANRKAADREASL
ncbi:Putative mitochondrial carrier protein Mtm1 [Septoria linicola]|uniref:Mitochondrial carrier protein Mtm1 n=1 Tax=Septoria linicola TaxID=215465 RepID=A0A9Q9AZZ4_9PEZI|nr:Putative mitochondrial carrier protein Mtm1 [Septoria linicola]